MALGEAAGFAVPVTVLVAMPAGMPPALVVERFDIRESLKDRRVLALEDLCSVLDLSTEAKYSGTMERVARAVRPLSTAPEEDLLIILRRALFAWLIADGDMHLKNMALLKSRNRETRSSAASVWRSSMTRSRPVYFRALRRIAWRSSSTAKTIN